MIGNYQNSILSTLMLILYIWQDCQNYQQQGSSIKLAKMSNLHYAPSASKLGEMRYENMGSLSPVRMENIAGQGFQSRLKRLQEGNPLSRKVKSYKKHFPQSVNAHSELKQFGILREGGKLESIHDKLQIRDIAGTSPNQFQAEIFRNRLYGKGVDKQHIFLKQREQHFGKKQQKDQLRNQLPNISTVLAPIKQSEYSLPKYMNNSSKKGYNIQHVLDINLNKQETHRQMNPQSAMTKANTPQRRIKTEMDNNFEINRSNIFSYEKESREITSSLLRKWNPTHLTERINPLILKLPKLV